MREACFSGLPSFEDEGNVGPTEAKSIAHGHIHLSLPSLQGHEVQPQANLRVMEIDGGWNDPVM